MFRVLRCAGFGSCGRETNGGAAGSVNESARPSKPSDAASFLQDSTPAAMVLSKHAESGAIVII